MTLGRRRHGQSSFAVRGSSLISSHSRLLCLSTNYLAWASCCHSLSRLVSPAAYSAHKPMGLRCRPSESHRPGNRGHMHVILIEVVLLVRLYDPSFPAPDLFVKFVKFVKCCRVVSQRRCHNVQHSYPNHTIYFLSF
jgi:hypothetical protein